MTNKRLSLQTLRKALRASRLFSALFYGLHLDDLQIRLGSKSFEKAIDDAIEKFVPADKQSDTRYIDALKKDIRHSYYVCKSMPGEYFLMGLDSADDQTKKSFITDKFMYMTMARYGSRKKHDEEIENKYGFYQLAKPYFGRKVIEVTSSTTYDAFKVFAEASKDVILKPNDGAMGTGIRAAKVENEQQCKDAFHFMKEKGGTWIVEERIQQSKEMAVWNLSSVNTIRVMSVYSKGQFHIIKPFIRTGRKGAVVDNAGHGGVFANVDAQSGVVCTCGLDEQGNRYEVHPDSGVCFKGWQIPRYDELTRIVEKMHREIMPSHPYIGWDMALTDAGWVVIECNWGQFLSQYIDHEGLKPLFMSCLKGRVE
jgi:hypothetical protein